MKRNTPFAPLVFFAFLFLINQAQAQDTSLVRPRTVGVPVQPPQATKSAPTAQIQAPAKPGLKAEATQPIETSATLEEPEAKGGAKVATLFLTPAVIQSRITEAERLLKSKPLTTALPSPSIEFVTIAALDTAASRTHLVTLSKETFLTKGAEISLPSSLGTMLNIRVLRANGVNTAVSIFDPNGRALVPLVVEFPIEKRGLFREMAYYTSAHPALLTKPLALSGQSYVRSMLDLAAKRLREKGAFVSAEIVNVAERLCIVEHVDHDRFRQENRLALYDEIYSLYALNQLDTYRYSVSTAGAGGMVQMIPWAYNLERQRHPGVGLIPDFVVGMRNHTNALQAMLLYMQDTWNELAANEDVKYALNAKLATTSELLAAGYNSNAAKLPSYIRRGGDSWKALIPRETQTYLQIYKSFESLVPLKERTSVAPPIGN
jgi:hypothetical protein